MMKETLKHKEAFEHYYAMGADRSLASLAGDCGVSEKSVKTWSRAFDWQARIELAWPVHDIVSFPLQFP